MPEPNVSKLKKRLQYEALRKKYLRVPRKNSDFDPSHIPDELAHCYPPPSGNESFYFAKIEPIPGLVLLDEDNCDEIPMSNMVLAYRMLKLLYGKPDILAACGKPMDDKLSLCPTGMEWGYLLQLSHSLFVEVRSTNANARLVQRFWSERRPKHEQESWSWAEMIIAFREEYVKSLKENAHLFEEEEEIANKPNALPRAIVNVFAQNYTAAVTLLGLAKTEDRPPPRSDLGWRENLPVSSRGTLYVASAIQFFSAMEALINTIFTLRLKAEFESELYQRITVKADIDVRFITAHLFCRGFDSQILTPKTELWDRVIKLRNFRNAVVHGNVTSDHYIYVIEEDCNMFFYAPFSDFGGRKAERKKQKSFPTYMGWVGKGELEEIKGTVDGVIEGVRAAANDETRQWLDGWLWESGIQPSAEEMMTFWRKGFNADSPSGSAP